MSGINVKEVVLIVSDHIGFAVNWQPFNLLLVFASFIHMGVIALNDCHGDSGEAGFFCGKAWINCKIAQNKTYISLGNETTLCPIKTCFDPGCLPTLIDFDDRTAFADILRAFNFVMRWVCTLQLCPSRIHRLFST
jgi:hypothetical protein